MNLSITMGHFTKDPEISIINTQKGQMKKASFTLGVPRRFSKDKSDFIRYQALGTTADFIEKYFKKGSKALVTGRYTRDQWQEGNEWHESNYIIVDTIEFAESKKQESTAEVNEEYDYNDYTPTFNVNRDDLPF